MEDSLGLRTKPRGKPGRKKRTSVLCQVHGCGEELLGAKHYYLRYRICRQHSVEPCLLICGKQQRFCQQCGRFHLLTAFQGNQRSCKDKLKRHKARRRGSRRGQGGQRARRREPGSSDWEDGDDSSKSEDDSGDDSAEEAEGEGGDGEEEGASYCTSVAVAAARSGSSQGAAASGGSAQQAAVGEHAQQVAAEGGAPEGCPPYSTSTSPAAETPEPAGRGPPPSPEAQRAQRGKAAVKEEELEPKGGHLSEGHPQEAAPGGYATPVPKAASKAAGFPSQAEMGITGSDPEATHGTAACKEEEDCMHMDADELLLVLPALPCPCWGEPLLLLGGCCPTGSSGQCLEKQGSNAVRYESFPPPAEPAEPLPEDLPFDVPDFLVAEADLPPPPASYTPQSATGYQGPDSATGYQAAQQASHGHTPSYHTASYQHTGCHAGSPCHVSSPMGGFADHQLVPLSVGDMGSGVFGEGGNQQQPYPPSPAHMQLCWGVQRALPALAGCTEGAHPGHLAAHSPQHAQHAQQHPGSVFAATMAGAGAGSSAGSGTSSHVDDGSQQQPWLRYQHAAPAIGPHNEGCQKQPAAHAAPAAPAVGSPASTCHLSSVFQPILSAGQGPSPFFPPPPKQQQQLGTPTDASASASAGVPTSAARAARDGWENWTTSLLPPAAATIPHSIQGAGGGYAARRCDSAAALCDEDSPIAGGHGSVFLASHGRQGGVLKGRIIRADSALLLATV